MSKKRFIKIYKTPEEKEEFYRRFWNRVSLQAQLYESSQPAKFFPDANERIIPIASNFKFSLS